jgi:phage I-like protein
MPRIALTPDQQTLKSKMEEILADLLHWHELSSEELQEYLDALSEAAFDLHEQLKAEGQEPQHAKLLIFKRGKNPDSPDFYRNMETCESLLEFIEGTT